MEDTSAGRRLRAHRQGRTIAIVGLATFAVAYAVSVGSAIYLGLDDWTSDLRVGPQGQRTAAMRREVETSRHWALQLIPLAGPFLFADRVPSGGYAALGVTLGVLQALGAITVPSGLMLRF